MKILSHLLRKCFLNLVLVEIDLILQIIVRDKKLLMDFWSKRFTEGFLCFSFKNLIFCVCLQMQFPSNIFLLELLCTQNLCVLYLLFIKVLQAILWSKCVTWQCFYTLKTLRQLLLILCDETLLLAALSIPQNPLLHLYLINQTLLVAPGLRKQPTFWDATTGLPTKWCLRNQCRNLGSDTSSVRNFCARFSKVSLQGNHRCHHLMSAVFPSLVFLNFSPLYQQYSDKRCRVHVF